MSDELRLAEIRRNAKIIKESLHPIQGIPEREREKIITACKNAIINLLGNGETLERFLNE